jgi:uncharacterized protein YdbL (DUF1318 family)
MSARNLPGFLAFAVLLMTALTPQLAAAQANLEINTPSINSIRNSMQARYPQMEPLFASGAVGLTRDGMVALRDANAVPINQRAAANALVAQENQDRGALYREIARANGHPEWEGDIRNVFGQRWIDRAQPGWWYQDASGAWKKK